MRAARVVNLFAAQTFYDRCRASNLRCPPALYDQLRVLPGGCLRELEKSVDRGSRLPTLAAGKSMTTGQRWAKRLTQYDAKRGCRLSPP